MVVPECLVVPPALSSPNLRTSSANFLPITTPEKGDGNNSKEIPTKLIRGRKAVVKTGPGKGSFLAWSACRPAHPGWVRVTLRRVVRPRLPWPAYSNQSAYSLRARFESGALECTRMRAVAACLACPAEGSVVALGSLWGRHNPLRRTDNTRTAWRLPSSAINQRRHKLPTHPVPSPAERCAADGDRGAPPAPPVPRGDKGPPRPASRPAGGLAVLHVVQSQVYARVQPNYYSGQVVKLI